MFFVLRSALICGQGFLARLRAARTPTLLGQHAMELPQASELSVVMCSLGPFLHYTVLSNKASEVLPAVCEVYNFADAWKLECSECLSPGSRDLRPQELGECLTTARHAVCISLGAWPGEERALQV